MTSQEERDIVAELRDEYLRVSSNSINGCADCGISANLATEAADTIERQRATIDYMRQTMVELKAHSEMEIPIEVWQMVDQALDPRP